jgi:hypothetical protein
MTITIITKQATDNPIAMDRVVSPLYVATVKVPENEVAPVVTPHCGVEKNEYDTPCTNPFCALMSSWNEAGFERTPLSKLGYGEMAVLQDRGSPAVTDALVRDMGEKTQNKSVSLAAPP